jgi:hypothetical protein
MRTKALCLFACLMGALGACTDEEPEPKRPVQPAATSSGTSETFTVNQCGSDELERGAEISERVAIEIAFGRREVATCSRFDTELKKRGSSLLWWVTLGPKSPGGCSITKYVNAETGYLLKSGSSLCP